MMVWGGSLNYKVAAAVLSLGTGAKSKSSRRPGKGKGRGRGRAKRKAPKVDVQVQTLDALLCKIGHYLHVAEQQRDFQVFEITEMITESDWGTVSVEQVQDAWTELQNEPRGLFMCTEVDPDGDGDAEKDWHRSTHLTFQEFFGAKRCVIEARAADSIAGYFKETFTASPNPWLREVLLMTTELLSADEFEQVATFYLDAEDGSGASSVRVDQMLESRREDRAKGVGARIMKRLSQTRSVDMMVNALRHPCEELRDLALTEIEKFRMPKEQVAARLVKDLAEPALVEDCPWYIRQAGKKTALFEPFIYKMHYFTKTGSGQT
jgi:ribosomal protein L19E